MRFIGLIAALLTLGGAAPPRNPGYLPQLGPVPLRFQPLRQAPPAPLPPLPSTDTQTLAQAESSNPGPKPSPEQNPAAETAKSGNPSPLTGKPHPATSENLAPSNPAGETNLVPVITPQMLMQFIIDRAAVAREPAPLDTPTFQPPSPPPVPSSSATYISEPAR